MPIQFPDDHSSRVDWLSICAVFPPDDSALSAIIPDDGSENMIEARYESDGKALYVQRITSRFPDGKLHLHVNIAGEDYFDGEPPEDLVDLDEVAQGINQFIGHTALLVLLRGRATLPKDELPDRGLPMNLSGLETEIGGETLELVGATFSISGTPYDQLRWNIQEDSVTGRLHASFRDYTLDQDYLVVAQDTIKRGIEQFLLEIE